MSTALYGAGFVALTVASFPHPIFGRVVDLGLVCAWAVPAFLILALEGLGVRKAALRAFLLALIAQSIIQHWIYVVTVVYGRAPTAVGAIAPVALALYTALFASAFGAGLAWLRARGAASPLALALLWTVVDHTRSFAFTGWPWATLGYAQHLNAPLLGLASVTGVYGLSFTTALGGAALAEALRALRHRHRPRPSVWLALGLVAALHGAGAAARALSDAPSGPSVRIAALQGNVDQGVKWSGEWSDRIATRYEELTEEAVAAGAQIVVWPETAVPGALEGDPELDERIRALARRTGATLVVGGVGIDFGPSGLVEAWFDSAFVFSPEGELLHRYDKSHLVPFGEYVPLRGLLGSFLGAVARGMAPTDVTAGLGPRAVSIPVGGGRREGREGAAHERVPVRVGIPICYELLFPDLVRRFPRDGAQVLLAITNDAWYGRTGAPYQFLAMTALRSAETRLWSVRAANTGVSAIIDPSGRVRDRTRIFERGFVLADVPLRAPGGRESFYVRHGDVFALSCWVGLAALAAVAANRARLGGRGETADE